MKKLAAVLIFTALSFSAHAQTVSMTLTASTADVASYSAMCGDVQGLKTNPTDVSTRSCNTTELKTFINTLVLRPWNDWKGAQLQKAAAAAVTVPTLSFTTN